MNGLTQACKDFAGWLLTGWKKNLLLAGVFILVCIVFALRPAPEDIQRILNIQNYFITVSGIISGIIIAYLSGKLFNIKEERSRRQIEIDHLSNKLTNYRRLLYFLMNTPLFWVYHREISRFKRQYPNLNFFVLGDFENKTHEDERVKFLLEDKTYHHTTIKLYLAMEAIYGENELATWAHSRIARFRYSSQEVLRCYDPSSTIWYFLEGGYSKWTKGEIDDTKMPVYFLDGIRDSLSAIETKYRDRDLDRHLMAEISNEFYEVYLPELYDLTLANESKLPQTLLSIYYNLIFIFCLGVIFPLILECVSLPIKVDLFLTLTSVAIIVVVFCNFLFDFYRIMNEEIHQD